MKLDGKYIKSRRLELGYSLNNLAKLSDISPTMLSRYENGIILEADTSIVDKLASVLKCEVLDIIFTGDMLQCPVCKHKIISNRINSDSDDLNYVVCNYCNYVLYFKNSKEVK